jgi:hypothetical protein
MTAAARAVYAEGGVPALYRGLGLKLARAVPQSAVGFLAYEEAIKCCKWLRPDEEGSRSSRAAKAGSVGGV